MQHILIKFIVKKTGKYKKKGGEGGRKGGEEVGRKDPEITALNSWTYVFLVRAIFLKTRLRLHCLTVFLVFPT